MKRMSIILSLLATCSADKSQPKAAVQPPAVVEAIRLVHEPRWGQEHDMKNLARAASLLEDALKAGQGDRLEIQKNLLTTYYDTANTVALGPQSAEGRNWMVKFEALCADLKKGAWDDVEVLWACFGTIPSDVEQQAIVLKILKIDPKNARAHSALSNIYDNQGRMDESEEELEKAARFESDYELRSDHIRRLKSSLRQRKKFDRLKEVEREFGAN